MRIEKVSCHPPAGARELLLELGKGVNGFTGSSFHHRAEDLEDCLQALHDCEDPEKLSPGYVLQTNFWMLDDSGHVVGIILARHCLNERLIQTGGHIGYYVSTVHRRHGYATAAARLAIAFLKSQKVARILITTQPENLPSARVAQACGGILDTPGVHPISGKPTVRFWVKADA